MAMAGSLDAVWIREFFRTAASRRLAHGFRADPKTMRENRYVRYTQSAA
jgi:hypothetical protein